MGDRERVLRPVQDTVSPFIQSPLPSELVPGNAAVISADGDELTRLAQNIINSLDLDHLMDQVDGESILNELDDDYMDQFWDDDHMNQLTDDDTTYASTSLLERVLGRGWISEDSVRVFRAVRREIDRLGGPSLVPSLTQQDYRNILESSIRQEIQSLGAVFDFDLDPESEAVLRHDILEEIRNFPLGHWDGNLDIALALNAQSRNHGGGGLSEETIQRCIKTRNHTAGTEREAGEGEVEMCVVCQDCLYQEQEDTSIGTLECGHEYHVSCIEQWLRLKSRCPICRGEALSEES